MQTFVNLAVDKKIYDLANLYASQNHLNLSSLFEKFLKFLIINNSNEIELQKSLEWFNQTNDCSGISDEEIITIVKEVRHELFEKESTN